MKVCSHWGLLNSASVSLSLSSRNTPHLLSQINRLTVALVLLPQFICEKHVRSTHQTLNVPDGAAALQQHVVFKVARTPQRDMFVCAYINGEWEAAVHLQMEASRGNVMKSLMKFLASNIQGFNHPSDNKHITECTSHSLLPQFISCTVSNQQHNGPKLPDWHWKPRAGASKFKTNERGISSGHFWMWSGALKST